MRINILIHLTLFLVASAISPNCFFLPNGIYGSDKGTNFTNIEELTAGAITVESRVSSATICTRQKTQTLQGLQLTLTDPRTKVVTKL
jgi:hypothetical protein